MTDGMHTFDGAGNVRNEVSEHSQKSLIFDDSEHAQVSEAAASDDAQKRETFLTNRHIPPVSDWRFLTSTLTKTVNQKTAAAKQKAAVTETKKAEQ